MKKNLHPENYRPVIFHDTSSGERFLIHSTVETENTDTWKDGEKYPLYKVEISSASHPFYTGKETVIDTAGRVEKFKARQKAALRQAQGKQSKKSKAKSQNKKKEDPKQPKTVGQGKKKTKKTKKTTKKSKA